MTTTTLVATPDPAPFDIHAQPTWIALGIGKVCREYPGATVLGVDVVGLEDVHAYVLLAGRGSEYVACLSRRDMRVVYVDELEAS